jgi:hypothetical protein
MNSVELQCHIYLRYALFKILLVKRKGHFQMPDQFVEDIFLRGPKFENICLKDIPAMIRLEHQ